MIFWKQKRKSEVRFVSWSPKVRSLREGELGDIMLVEEEKEGVEKSGGVVGMVALVNVIVGWLLEQDLEKYRLG